MYAAKSIGKHCFAHYEPKMHAQVRRRHEFAVELQGAVERDEIGVVFEPIVDLRDGRIVGFEALARWYSPSAASSSRPSFIPVAEEIGLMSEIGSSVLRQACQAARRWMDAYPAHRDVTVSVNLSPSELASETLADDVARALFEARLPAENLMLEITESDVMWDLDIAHQRMDELRALGVRLVLDDFGTGRSSLERLDTFPLDAVKIAKPFVDRLLDPASESSFIDAFVRLAQSLEMRVHRRGDRARRPGADAARARLRARSGVPLRAADDRDGARPVPPDGSDAAAQGRLGAYAASAAEVSAPTSSAVATNARAAGEW